MSIQVPGPGTVEFQWKVSSEQWCDYLQFYIDDQLRYSIDGECDWRDDGPFSVTGTGAHRLKWRYVKDSNDCAGDDRGYVKNVTFTPPPPPEPDSLAEALDCGLTFMTDGNNGGWSTEAGSSCYHDWALRRVSPQINN